MHCARDDYLLRSRWAHVPRTPRAGPFEARRELGSPRPRARVQSSVLSGLVARLVGRGQGRTAQGSSSQAGELDIHAYLELEFAVDEERSTAR